MDWLELAEGWLEQHLDAAADKDHTCRACHDETNAATLLVIAKELRGIRQLLIDAEERTR